MIRPRVFISHSSKDKAFVESLVEYLEKANVKTWLDSRQLQPGDSIVGGIQDALTDSDYIVPVLSHHSIASRWVQAELNAAFMREMDGKGTRIIPIKIDDCDVPILLSDRVYIDFEKDFHDGVQKLADRLLIENAEVKVSIRFGRDLGLKKGSIAVHCHESYRDCTKQLLEFSLGDIENLLFHRLGLSDLGRLCYRVLEQSLDDFGARAPKGDLTTEFLCAVGREHKNDRLIEVLCQEFAGRL